MGHIRKLVKYGNSLAVVLPKEAAAELNLKSGVLVSIEVQDGVVQIRSVEVVPSLTKIDRDFSDTLYKKRKKVFKNLAKN